MHKLIEFICDELEDLERKVERGSKLSMAEVQYMDTLAHTKKNLLKGDEMESGYSMDRYSRDDRYSRAGRMYSEARGRGRNARRDSMGRYSRDRYSRDDYSYDDGYGMEGDFHSDLETLMDEAPNDQVKQKLKAIMAEVG